mmetsp:Transcript_81665/g.207479  ORF Transcript_81665/g.207479 Transcript_81665/m.207479 type:complete len:234 (+) Transcript_81665:380-1081(+)
MPSDASSAVADSKDKPASFDVATAKWVASPGMTAPRGSAMRMGRPSVEQALKGSALSPHRGADAKGLGSGTLADAFAHSGGESKRTTFSSQPSSSSAAQNTWYRSIADSTPSSPTGGQTTTEPLRMRGRTERLPLGRSSCSTSASRAFAQKPSTSMRRATTGLCADFVSPSTAIRPVLRSTVARSNSLCASNVSVRALRSSSTPSDHALACWADGYLPSPPCWLPSGVRHEAP